MMQQDSEHPDTSDTRINIQYSDYPDQSTLSQNGLAEVINLDQQETNQQKVNRLTLQKYSIEERIYLIINKQTGEVYDTRNDTTIDNLLRSSELSLSSQITNPNWDDYWKKVTRVKQDMMEAASTGKVARMEEILKRKSSDAPVDVNFKSFDNWTALHFAAYHCQVQAMQFLVRNKADVNAKTKFGWTPLHIASKKDQPSGGLLLLEAGADPNSKDQDEYTALHYAAENGDKEMVQILLRFKADYKLKNSFGRTAKDCSVNAETYNIFPNDAPTGYDKVVIEGVLIPNGRADHIERFLNVRKNDAPKPQSREFKEQPQKKFVNMFKMYKSMSRKEELAPEDFHFYKRLGRGAFGEVFLAKKKKDPVDRFYAIKILNKEKIVGTPLERYIKTEKDVLSLVSHPFLVRLYYSFQNESKLFLVMQFCEGGDMGMLLNKKRKFSEELTRYYVCEIVLALEALHKNMIIYRDLKPDNLMINKDGHCMITDFGLSKKIADFDKTTNSFCGTPAYMPLEILDKKGHNRMADWYTLGVVMYEFLTGVPPFYANTREELFKNKREHLLKLPRGVSEECKDILKQLMQKDYHRRLGIEKDAESVRQHPWFKGIDWQKVYNKQLELPKPQTTLTLGEPVVMKFTQIRDVKKLENWSFAV